MQELSPPTLEVEALLARLNRGDATALDDLIRHAGERLELLARQMLRRFPAVRRWTQTDDVLQGALLRLLRALQAVQAVTARDFFGLAAIQVRRELIDLTRHFCGPHGAAARHVSPNPVAAVDAADLSREPAALAEWCELHEQIDALPHAEREVVGLLYYQGLTQPQAAAVLNVTVRTVQRRWQAALVKLHRVLKGEWPGT
jgi:RNA polymerase sigma-70 factor (ECF subfamily)